MNIDIKEYLQELETLSVDEQIFKVRKDLREHGPDLLNGGLHDWIMKHKDRILELANSGALDEDQG